MLASTLGVQAGFVRRHGKAVQPLMSHGKAAAETTSDDQKSAKKFKKVKKTAPADSKPRPPGPWAKASSKYAEAHLQENRYAVHTSEGEGAARSPSTAPAPAPAPATMDPLTPLKTVLQMPLPESADEQNAAHPFQVQSLPYVHHFDTYTLVQQIQAGGFTALQSITAMKAVRALLAANFQVARAGLVSKSDVENESYLFRAACSELKTEIQNTRRKTEETMRRERISLQHEVEILNQKLTQELLTLKDGLKGMFDDRKMSVRMDQRTMESKIQELNYKITVMLNSDSKFEVEGLRWLLTRRSVMGILFMAFMVLTSLRYASYKSHENTMRRIREAEVKGEEIMEPPPIHGAVDILTTAG